MKKTKPKTTPEIYADVLLLTLPLSIIIGLVTTYRIVDCIVIAGIGSILIAKIIKSIKNIRRI